MLKYFRCHSDKKNGKKYRSTWHTRRQTFNFLQKSQTTMPRWLKAPPGFCAHALCTPVPHPNNGGGIQAFWLNSQWGDTWRGAVAMIIIFVLSTHKKRGCKREWRQFTMFVTYFFRTGKPNLKQFLFFYTSTAVEPGALAGITLNMSWCDSLSAVPLGANRLYNFFRGGGLLNNVVRVSVKAKGGGGEEGGFARHVLSSE